ncbi:hypothetical protein HNR19_003140 [Nocardioides thalensis]|uniref:ARG and Rhodanese-Phosphatase-superfamily-associated domain-containing protein n=1 Tax=Nocardioides thalensis TaxID=1914755 RepID=A0A853C6Y5_9ACTN|nr:DUF6569 family protein [Nocardioides thalensis]NYJ02442.1 hypothetical protein [Nocardioides thalensis]
MQLHVGAGTQRGALTIFPVWSDYVGPRGYTTKLDAVRVDECTTGASVPVLQVRNEGDLPVALFEGQILEGGWQNRMLARSLVVPAGSEVKAEVVCVEAGRWHGGDAHATRSRRASNRVRTGLREAAADARQQEVWRRIGEYDARFGPTATSSYVEHADRAAAEVKAMTRGLRPLAGQVGIVVGIAGQPIALEVFDNPWTFKAQFVSILTAAAMDALGQPALVTPSRRARRFADRVTGLPRRRTARAGAGATATGRNEYVDAAALEFRDHVVHLVATSPKHELAKAAA